jgi:hypothetical protein
MTEEKRLLSIGKRFSSKEVRRAYQRFNICTFVPYRLGRSMRGSEHADALSRRTGSVSCRVERLNTRQLTLPVRRR